MTARPAPRVLSVPAGVPFLPTLASALVEEGWWRVSPRRATR